MTGVRRVLFRSENSTVFLPNGEFVTVDVSAQAIVRANFVISGLANPFSASTVATAYLSSQMASTDFEQCVLLNTNGLVIAEMEISSSFNYESLTEGLYVLQYQSQTGETAFVRVLKN